MWRCCCCTHGSTERTSSSSSRTRRSCLLNSYTASIVLAIQPTYIKSKGKEGEQLSWIRIPSAGHYCRCRYRYHCRGEELGVIPALWCCCWCYVFSSFVIIRRMNVCYTAPVHPPWMVKNPFQLLKYSDNGPTCDFKVVQFFIKNSQWIILFPIIPIPRCLLLDWKSFATQRGGTSIQQQQKRRKKNDFMRERRSDR